MTRRADVADLVAFLAAVGPRIDEAMRVRWEGVDFGAGAVHIPGTKTETSDRTLSVARWAMDALRERYHLEGSPPAGYVFHGPHGGLEESATSGTLLARCGRFLTTPGTRGQCRTRSVGRSLRCSTLVGSLSCILPTIWCMPTRP